MMPAIALACLAGNLFVQQLPRLPSGAMLLALVTVALLALGNRHTRLASFALGAFVLTALAAHARLEQRLPSSLAGRDVSLHGWIDEFPGSDAERIVLSFRAEGVRPAGVPRRLRLSWYDPPAGLTAGASLSVVARLRPPRGFANPDGFDYERWLYLKGYGATGYVRSGAIDGASYGAAQAWLRLRARIAAHIGREIGAGRAAALIGALALGERSGFGENDWRDLRRTGTSHLVAISGMHIGLLAMLSFLVLRRLVLCLPSACAAYDLELAAAGAALLSFAYAALAGFTLPTQRALLMLIVALVALVSRRRIGPFTALGTALIAVLAADPMATLSASFALSFGAVALLVSIGSQRHIAGMWQRSRLARLVKLQCAVTLGLLPLGAAFFGQMSLIAVLVNLIAIPWFCFVLVPLALCATVALSVPIVGTALLQLAGFAAALTWDALGWAADLPWAAVMLPAARISVLIVAAIGTVLALPAHCLPGRRLAWIALLPLFWAAPQRPRPGQAQAVVLDVGHGLAVLVETAEHRLLYDAGARFRSGFDVGREIVVPTIRRRARGTLDMLIVSHADNDHAGGAPAVVQAFSPGRRLLGPDVGGLDGVRCRRGQRWNWDGVQFSMLHPPSGFRARGNDSSCVLKITARGSSMLITGDIESRAERLLSAGAALRADVVVVPHHGSATSSSAGFVAATGAELAIVSAAYDSRWGFPKPEVRARWRRAGADLLVTGESGAILVKLGDAGPAARASRDIRPRYWHAERTSFPGASTGSAL